MCIDHNHDNFHREPDLNCPPFQVNHYMAYVNIGSYVEFISSVNLRCYGRVTSSRMGTNNSPILMIDQFVELEKINAMLMNDENIPTLRNQYVDVTAELVQTNHVVEVNSAPFTNIIFVFKKDEVVSGNYPCKGMASIHHPVPIQ